MVRPGTFPRVQHMRVWSSAPAGGAGPRNRGFSRANVPLVLGRPAGLPDSGCVVVGPMTGCALDDTGIAHMAPARCPCGAPAQTDAGFTRWKCSGPRSNGGSSRAWTLFTAAAKRCTSGVGGGRPRVRPDRSIARTPGGPMRERGASSKATTLPATADETDDDGWTAVSPASDPAAASDAAAPFDATVPGTSWPQRDPPTL